LEQQRYGDLLSLDFNYFNSKFCENFERKLESEQASGEKSDLKAIF
jgi:hypothetical protein